MWQEIASAIPTLNIDYSSIIANGVTIACEVQIVLDDYV